MFLKQIKHIGDNFSYVVADNGTKEAAVIDPSFNSEAIIQIARRHRFDIRFVIDTHHHYDHVKGNKAIKSVFNSKIVAHKASTINKDIEVVEGDKLVFGEVIIIVLHTPGHTPDSICLMADGKLMTGDTLFVGGCGRTDLPGGSVNELHESLSRLMDLRDDIEVYPGHDYGSKPNSTIGREKRINPFI
jgi:hydroxyacylglutathione hydrolase